MFAPRGWLKRPVARRIYRTIASSGLFDARWYRSTQVSGRARPLDPLWHYLDHGAALGLDPSPMFDTSHYVHTNHDVRSSGINPLFHYLEYGTEERRSPLRSVIQTRDHLLPDSKEIETFTSSRLQEPRVTMVIDSRSTLEHSLSLEEFAQTALAFSREESRTLRVISWVDTSTEMAHPEPEIYWIAAKQSNPLPTFDAHEDEYFLATSSTSALSLRFAAPLSRQWHYSSREKGAIHQMQSAPSLSEVTEPHFPPPASEGIASAGRVPVRTSTKARKMVVFANALTRPVAYLRCLEALNEVFLNRPELCAQWQVVACGLGVEPSMLAGLVPVTHADHFVASRNRRLDLALMAISDSALSDKLAALAVPQVSERHLATLEHALDEVSS